MSNGDSVWYVPGGDNKPSGPFSAEELFQRWRSGGIADTTSCWREGMAEWQPLGQVEPFATAIKRAKAVTAKQAASPTQAVPSPRPVAPPHSSKAIHDRLRPQRSPLRLALSLVLALAVLGGGGYVGYLQISKHLTLREARDLIEAEKYAKVARLLDDFLDEHEDHPEASYLLALARLKEYAEEDDQKVTWEQAAGEGNPLRKTEKLFEDAFDPDQKWLEQAKTDLTDVLDSVPEDAPDLLSRSLLVGRLLDDLDIVDPSELADQLLDQAARTPPPKQTSPYGMRSPWPPAVLVKAVTTWDLSSAGRLIARVLPADGANTKVVNAGMVVVIAWAREDAQLGPPLAAGLLQQADRYIKAGHHDAAAIVFNTVIRIAPGNMTEVRQRQLGLFTRRLATGSVDDARAVIRELQRMGELPVELYPNAAKVYLECALKLREADKNSAKIALDAALKLDSSITDREDIAFLRIDLAPQPDEAKLADCQRFLQKHPQSPRLPQVLMIILNDAVAAHARHARWHPEKAKPYLTAGEQAANELLANQAKTAGLDQSIHTFAQHLGTSKQYQQALDLDERLLQAVPETPLKTQIIADMDGWRRQLVGNLSPELMDLSLRTDKELEKQKMTMSTPGQIAVIQANPRAIRVIEVADACVAKSFRTEQADALRKWVADGGILWARNDVLTLFEVGYGAWGYGGQTLCDRSVSAEVCPVLTRVSKVRLLPRPGHAIDLAAGAVVPLLTSAGSTRWSLVKYRDGWITDTKPVDTNQHDGARFWLNFRLFCLGWDIPDAPAQNIQIPPPGTVPPPKPEVSGTPPAPPAPPARDPKEDLATITTVEALSQALAAAEKKPVMWVRLSGTDLLDKPELRKQLQDWVRQGGVLWTDTDLARAFRFLFLKPAPQQRNRGYGGYVKVLAAEHKVLEGLSKQTIQFDLAPSGLIISGSPTAIQRSMTPMLAWASSANELSVVCAVRDYEKGKVIYRPGSISNDAAGKKFENNLMSFSAEQAKAAAP